MAKSFSKIRGGHRLKAWTRKIKRIEADSVATVEVGFHDKRMSNLALLHEFGHFPSGLPQRPAFRVGVLDAKAEYRRQMRAVGRRAASPSGVVDMDAEIDAAGKSARDTIKRSYLTHESEPLSERQRRRKTGTAYEDRQLVGRRGPRLVEHIESKRTK